jgi:hypothetical protein
MHVLHILKTEPDDIVVELMAAFDDDRSETVSLFADDVDWEGLVDRIFTADKVICWW